MFSSTLPATSTASQPRLLDRLRTALHLRGVPAAEAAVDVGWAEAFIRFHGLRHPDQMAEAEVGAFLTHLAVERHESLPRLAEAHRALLFFYRDFVHRDLADARRRGRARSTCWATCRPTTCGRPWPPAKPCLISPIRNPPRATSSTRTSEPRGSAEVRHSRTFFDRKLNGDTSLCLVV